MQHIVLKLGNAGAALCTLSQGQRQLRITHIPALPAAVVNCSGAGDCLVAGCLYGLTTGETPEQALACDVAAAKAAVESRANVPAQLTAAAVEAGAAAALARAVRLTFPTQQGCSCATCGR